MKHGALSGYFCFRLQQLMWVSLSAPFRNTRLGKNQVVSTLIVCLSHFKSHPAEQAEV
jgi:hypothetical protein